MGNDGLVIGTDHIIRAIAVSGLHTESCERAISANAMWNIRWWATSQVSAKHTDLWVDSIRTDDAKPV